MSILVLGATGKTGTHVVQLLRETDPTLNVIPVSRPTFDWSKPDTYASVLTAEPPVKAVYIVAPNHELNVLGTIRSFVELAISKGVKRFVLLSAALAPKGGPMLGEVQEYLESDEVTKRGITPVTIKPSFFYENFTLIDLDTIKKENTIVSAKGKGRLGWVAARDIAQAAVDALLADNPPHSDVPVFGPELLTTDDAAKIFSEVLGRTITHTAVSEEEMTKRFSSRMPAEYAAMLAGAEALVAKDWDVELFDLPSTHKGKITLKEWIAQNKHVWAV
ncbi:NAD(P)-binding protein [Cylindrobasidium torrendii FP15055 ss-10]|uniref:NAD(P)-binding protein n=1 Tax=Cylindrobasidium torrendii FP15055 ss-10 TaxID=1314674 RepID=A0A0D7BQU7_9AGAR|nr:NAD(P)-binding protein [Cylindrobasidium torrendii FP15055 ss-10]